MSDKEPKNGLGVAQVIMIAAMTFVVLDWLRSKPFGEQGGLLLLALLLTCIIVYGVVGGWLAVRDVEKEERREARRHGYKSWAEYMAAEGDEFVRDSWQQEARRERNRLSRRLSRLFTGRD